MGRLITQRAAQGALSRVRAGLALSWVDMGRYLDVHFGTLERWASGEEKIPSPRLLIPALERLVELRGEESSS